MNLKPGTLIVSTTQGEEHPGIIVREEGDKYKVHNFEGNDLLAYREPEDADDRGLNGTFRLLK